MKNYKEYPRFRVVVMREQGLWRAGKFFKGTSEHKTAGYTEEQLKLIAEEPLFQVDWIDEPEAKPADKKGK